MEHDFEKCNSCIVFDGNTFKYGSLVDVLNRQRDYIEAGLIPDVNNDLFVREGYGALCFFCGDCSSLTEVIREASIFNNFYNFFDKLNDGYKFVIGPGIRVKKNFVGYKLSAGYAVYCSNYLEILNRSKQL